MVEEELVGLAAVQYALSPSQLQQHHDPCPAGFLLSTCMAAQDDRAVVTSTHPPDQQQPMQERVGSLFVRNPVLAGSQVEWFSDGHKWWLDGCWSLDDEDMQQQLNWQEVAGGGRVFKAPLEPDTRLHQWITAQLQPPAGSSDHGITLSRVEVVKSATTLGLFNYRMQQTAARLTANGGKNPFVRTWPSDETKTAMLRHLESQFAAAERDGVRVLPLWHGCSADDANEIMSKGPAALATLDLGYFGSGIYFSQQPDYAAAYPAKVFSGQTTGVCNVMLLLCAVCVGSVYPITRGEDYADGSRESKYYGRPLHSGCDAHFALIDSTVGYQAAKVDTPLQHHFDEVVVSQESQVLPIAKVLVEVDRQQLGRYLGTCPIKAAASTSAA